MNGGGACEDAQVQQMWGAVQLPVGGGWPVYQFHTLSDCEPWWLFLNVVLCGGDGGGGGGLGGGGWILVIHKNNEISSLSR